MITTLLFDLDNTLYSPSFGMEDDVIRRMNEYVVKVLQKPLEECRKIRSERLPHYGTTLEWLMAEHGVTDVEDYFRYVHPEGEEAVLSREPAVRLALEALPYPKYILTNAPMEHADRVLKALGLEGFFERVFDIRFNHLKGKPHRDAYCRVCEAMGVPVEAVLFVDDIPRYADGFTSIGGLGVLIDQNDRHKDIRALRFKRLANYQLCLRGKEYSMFRNLWLYDFKQTGDDYCVLSFPLWFRLVMMALVLFVLYATNLWFKDLISLAWAFTVLMGLSIITEDRWIFNKRAGSMTRVAGVLFFAKRWAIALEEIESVCVSADVRALIQEGDPFAKTMLFDKPGIAGFALRLYDGKNVVMSHISVRQKERLFAQATRLAAFIDKPVVEEKADS